MEDNIFLRADHQNSVIIFFVNFAAFLRDLKNADRISVVSAEENIGGTVAVF